MADHTMDEMQGPVILRMSDVRMLWKNFKLVEKDNPDADVVVMVWREVNVDDSGEDVVEMEWHDANVWLKQDGEEDGEA